MGYRLAVAGATTEIGREMLAILDERQFPVDDIVALVPRKSLGSEVSFGDRTLKGRDAEGFDWTGTDLALLALDAEGARIHAPLAARAGALVIDASGGFATDPAVPLVVPEANGAVLDARPSRGIIASAAGMAALLAPVLAPLHARARLTRVVATTLHAVSETGGKAMDELWRQTKGMYVPGQEVAPNHLPRQIAFNLIPQAGTFMDDGATDAEWALAAALKKILGPRIRFAVTAVQVPVFAGHSASLTVETEDFLDEDEARDILREAPGLMLAEKAEAYVTPAECVGDHAVFVGRVRQDGTAENGLSLWVTGDHLRKGAALNAVQIAEIAARRLLARG